MVSDSKSFSVFPLEVTCSIAGIPFHYIPLEKRATIIHEILQGNTLRVIFTPNPEILLKSIRLPWYKEILKKADWNMPDGRGLLWASTFESRCQRETNSLKKVFFFILTYIAQVLYPSSLKKILPGVITGQDSFFRFHQIFAEQGTKVFYFGGENGVDALVAEKMQKDYPGIQVVGHCGGYPYRSNEEGETIRQQIAKAGPEVLFVALSFPKQEQWVDEHRVFLQELGVKMVMIVGGTYDVAVGKIKKAPAWIKASGLEFIWRLILEPHRLGRICDAVFIFPWKILLLALFAEPVYKLEKKDGRKTNV